MVARGKRIPRRRCPPEKPWSAPSVRQDPNYGIEFNRSFFRGGTLGLSNRLGKNPGAYGFYQGLSYTQALGSNFMGRSFLNELDRLKMGIDHSRLQGEASVQDALHLFAREYVSVKLNETLYTLQKEALDRAKKRVVFIEERVRNGLKERVDLYQSRAAVLSQEEQLSNIQGDVTDGLYALSRQIGRDVAKGEVAGFALTTGTLTPPRGEYRSGSFTERLKARPGDSRQGFPGSRIRIGSRYRPQTRI